MDLIISHCYGFYLWRMSVCVSNLCWARKYAENFAMLPHISSNFCFRKMYYNEKHIVVFFLIELTFGLDLGATC